MGTRQWQYGDEGSKEKNYPPLLTYQWPKIGALSNRHTIMDESVRDSILSQYYVASFLMILHIFIAFSSLGRHSCYHVKHKIVKNNANSDTSCSNIYWYSSKTTDCLGCLL